MRKIIGRSKARDAGTIAKYLGSTDQFATSSAQYTEALQATQSVIETFPAAIRSGRLCKEPDKDGGLEFLQWRNGGLLAPYNQRDWSSNRVDRR